MLIPNRRISAKRQGLNTVYSPGKGWTGHQGGEGPAPLPDPPTITDFVPTSGEVGASIVITGTNFDTANRVQFFNGVNAQFVIDSATQITATVPAGAETGPINVRNPGGTATSVGDFTVEVPVGAPVITSFLPTTGSEDEQITVTGTDFTGSTAVTIGGGNCPTFFVDNDTTIRVNISGLARSGKIAITNPQGTGVSVDNFHVEQQVLSYTPNSGQENDPIQINGQNFLDASAVTFFNGVNQPVFSVFDNTRIDCNVPAGAADGVISVTTPWGTKSGPSFDVLPKAPVVNSYTPNSGQVGDGITINGTDFVEVTAVDFNGTDQPVFNVVDPNTITCNVPAGATDGAISVTNPGGTGVGPAFDVLPATPVVSSYTPDNAAEGEGITINGTDFTEISAVTFFDGVDQPVFNVQSAIAITCNVPVGAATGAISVTNPGGTGVGPTFTVNPGAPLPIVSSFDPTSGAVGQFITINGSNFTGATGADVNGTALDNFNIVSESQVNGNVAAGTTSGLVGVTNAAGRGVSLTAFNVETGVPELPAFQGSVVPAVDGFAFEDVNSLVPVTVNDPGSIARVIKMDGATVGATEARYTLNHGPYLRTDLAGTKGPVIVDTSPVAGGTGNNAIVQDINPGPVTAWSAAAVLSLPTVAANGAIWYLDGTFTTSRNLGSTRNSAVGDIAFRAFNNSLILFNYTTLHPDLILLIVRASDGDANAEIWLNGGVVGNIAIGTDVWAGGAGQVMAVRPEGTQYYGDMYFWQRKLTDQECIDVQAFYEDKYIFTPTGPAVMSSAIMRGGVRANSLPVPTKVNTAVEFTNFSPRNANRGDQISITGVDVGRASIIRFPNEAGGMTEQTDYTPLGNSSNVRVVVPDDAVTGRFEIIGQSGDVAISPEVLEIRGAS